MPTPSSVSRGRVCPRNLVTPWKWMGKSFLKTKEKTLYLQRASEASHRTLGSRGAAPLAELSLPGPVGDRDGVSFTGSC